MYNKARCDGCMINNNANMKSIGKCLQQKAIYNVK